MKIEYTPHKFSVANQAIIVQADAICEEYADQGYGLTLRQLYYRFVAGGLIPNNDKEYKHLGSVINDARLAGEIDWDHLEDRTRNLQENSHWVSPAEVIRSAALGYSVDKWEGQQNRVEVWVEKDALVGVVERAASQWDVPYFSCRGYVSQSEMHAAATRFKDWEDQGYETWIIHLGDHDPSGMDMTRDIQDRLTLFGANTQVKRVALNWDQIEEYSPPPNPAKLTDVRSTKYVAEHGESSWELDALEPRVLNQIIESEVKNLLDIEIWHDNMDKEAEHKRLLNGAVRHWEALVPRIKGLEGLE